LYNWRTCGLAHVLSSVRLLPLHFIQLLPSSLPPELAGGLTLADLVAKQAELEAKLAKVEQQQAAVDAELLPVLQKGLFTVLDKDDNPICCGFFVTDAGVALTVRHEHTRWLRDGGLVRAVMLRADEAAGSSGAGGSSAAAPGEVSLTFSVHSFSDEKELGYTCMVLISPVPTGTFQPLAIPAAALSNDNLVGAHATLLHGSIAYNRFFHLDPSASLVACSIFTAHADRILYTAATFGGDSGGALLLSGKRLVAMHVEGMNDVPEDLEAVNPSAGNGRRTKRIKLSEASPSTVSVALRLDLPAIRGAIEAAHAAALLAAAGAAGA
jgi:hypothetical protein